MQRKRVQGWGGCSDDVGMMRRTLLTSILFGVTFCGATLPVAGAWTVKNTGEGDEIRWAAGEIFVESSMGSEDMGESADIDPTEAIVVALQTWNHEISATHEIITVEYTDEAETLGRDGHNRVRWGTDPDDSFVDPDMLATTYMYYDSASGEITEADIVVNLVDYEWTDAKSEKCHDRYDLENILAHEAGHFLGLSHSADHEESTMYPSARSCETKKRILEEDDQAGIAYLYRERPVEEGESNSIAGVANCSVGGQGHALLWAIVFAVLMVCQKRSLQQENRGSRKHRDRRRRGRRSGLRWPERVGSNSIVILVLSLSAVFSSSRVEASTGKYLLPAQLAKRAELVAEGHVVAQKTVLIDRVPTTLSTLRVTSCNRFRCPDTVVVAQLGGEVEGIGLTVFGVTPLETGATVLIFLKRQGIGMRPIAMGQGVFRVYQQFGIEFLSRDLESMTLIGTQTPILSLLRSDVETVFGVRLRPHSFSSPKRGQ